MPLNFLNTGYFADKVGIGTESPFSPLQVGQATFTGANGMVNDSRVGISNHGSLTGMMLASTYNDATYPEYGLVFIQGPSTSSYNVWSISPDGPAKGSGLSFIYKADATNIHNQTPQVYFEGSTGYVGIGTSSPGAKLEIKDGDLWLNGTTSNYNPEIFFIDDAGPTGIAGAKIRYENNNGNLYFDHKWDTATSGFFFRNRVDGTALNTMSLVNGKVGIEIDTPQAPLSFANVAGNKIDFYYNTTTNDRYGIQVQASELRIHSGAAGDSTGGITFGKDNGTTFTEAMRVRNDGNVGIGETSPGTKLVIQGTNDAAGTGVVEIKTTGTNLKIGGNATYSWIQSHASKPLYINQLGNNVILNLGGGNVGIGTASPTAKLHVVGTGLFTGLVSGITPVNAANFVTKAYVDGSGGGTGPFLPLAGGTMTGTNGVLMPDNFKLKFGDATTPDLEIFHNGSNSYVRDSGTGGLVLEGSTMLELKARSGELYLRGNENSSVQLYHNNNLKLYTANTGVAVTGDINIDSALLSNQNNTDVDTGTEAIASVVLATYTAAFFDFVIKKGTNVRSGTVYACHDGTNVEFTETSTQDLGDTSDVTLNVVISTIYLQLQATTTSDDWSVKSLIRAI